MHYAKNALCKEHPPFNTDFVLLAFIAARQDSQPP
jgi:hypothetical protein